MKNKVIIPTILFIAILIFSFFAFSQEKDKNQLKTSEPASSEPVSSKPASQENQQSSQIILFYGDGCPHCALVEEYVNQNGVEAKAPFVKKEVYYNKQNASELAEKAAACGMPTDSIGVPFLWDGTKCLVGDQPIIDFFKAKINQQ